MEMRGSEAFPGNADALPPEVLEAGLDGIVFRGSTAVQNVLIADTRRYGRVLVLDGVIQSAAADEHLYHEMLVQPAMLRHFHPRDVLIIGGGEGATLREVLKHESVRTVTMVDIDRQLVDIAREHLAGWHQGAFDDARVRMFFDDGRRFIERDGSLHDVVIIDVVDSIEGGPAQSLYTREFYRSLRQRLRPGAIVVVQAMEFSCLNHHEHVRLACTLKAEFRQVHSYRCQIPSFLSEWSFILASDWCGEPSLGSEDFDNAITVRLGRNGLRHLDGDYIQASFVLDKQSRTWLAAAEPIFEDPHPVADGTVAHPTLGRRVQFPLARSRPPAG